MKKKLLLSSIATIMVCLCLISGSTYALFTNSTNVNIAVTAGKVDVVATVDEASLEGSSLGVPAVKDNYGVIHFANGGTAQMSGSDLKIATLTPGDFVTVTIQGSNESNIAIKYRYVVKITEGADVAGALTVKVNGSVCSLAANNTYFASDWVSPDPATGIGDVLVSVGMDADVGNTDANGNSYQGKTVKISVVLEAVQGNGIDANGNLIDP